MASLIDLVCADPSAQTAYLFRGRDGDTTLSRAALRDGACRVAACLQQCCPAGSAGLLLMPPGPDFILGFFGVVLAGMVAVPVAFPKPNRPVANWNHVAADCGAHFVLCSAASAAMLRGLFAGTPLLGLTWICIEDAASSDSAAWIAPAVTGASLAFLQYTSGTTGASKGVALSHDNLLSNLEAIRINFRLDRSSRGVIWLPPYHDMGLIGGVLVPLYVGFPVLLLAPLQFQARPLSWLQAISDFRATISGAPNFAYDYCCDRINAEQRASLDLGSWQVAFVGSEPVQATTLERFAAAFEAAGFSHLAWHPCYGLAEATLLVTGKSPGTAPTVCGFARAALERGTATAMDAGDTAAQTLVSCGVPAHATAVSIVQPRGGPPCADGQVGEVVIRGPGVAGGAGPALRSGDLGFLWRGELFVCGRLKEMLIFRGRNFFPHDLEQATRDSHPAFHACGGAAIAVAPAGQADALVLIQETSHTCRSDDYAGMLAALRRALSLHFDLQARAIVLVAPGTIARTSSGKVRRVHAREQYLAHGFAAQRITHKETP